MLIWGTVGIFVRFAEQPAPTIVFFRVSIAFAALSIYFCWHKRRLYWHGQKIPALISGIFLALNWLFFFQAIQLTTIGNAVLSYYMAPLFAVLWARLFLGERLERHGLYALLLAMLGIGLIVSSYDFSLSNQDFLGIVCGLIGALFYSLVVILVKRLSIAPSQLVLIQTGIASLVFLPFVVIHPPQLKAFSIMAMGTLGLVHSAIALGLYFTGLKLIKIQHVSVLSYIEPVSSMVYAYLIFGEIPTLLTLIGGLCILAASSIVLCWPKQATLS